MLVGGFANKGIASRKVRASGIAPVASAWRGPKDSFAFALSVWWNVSNSLG
jgi:hypothetical protein